MHRILFLIPFIFTLFIGCGTSHDSVAQMTTTASPTPTKKIDTASNINNDFSFDIYRHMGSEDKNTFLSGYIKIVILVW